MKKVSFRMFRTFLTLLMLLVSDTGISATWDWYKEFAATDEVNHLNLNGNLRNGMNVVNGGLDNTNPTTGFEFVEILGALPVAGNEGRIVFRTSDDTLNMDNGTAWVYSPTYLGDAVQGDVLYFDGSTWARLGSGTVGNTLKTGGAAANPSWAALNLAAGAGYITGTLPTGSGGTGATAASNAANGVCILDATGNVDTDLVDAGSIEANAVTNEEMADNAIHQAELYTTTGEVYGTAVLATLPGGTYGFYPQCKHAHSSDISTAAPFHSSNGPENYATTIQLTSDQTNLYVQQRYIQSSGNEHWIFLLYDNVKNENIAGWSAPDHPCYGQGVEEDKIPHPFVEYWNKPLPENLEIILLDNDKLETIKKKVNRNKGILEIIDEEYMIDENSHPNYQPREIIELDEWEDRTGEIIKTYKNKTNYGKNKALKCRMVHTLPEYIKYRSLKKKGE